MMAMEIAPSEVEGRITELVQRAEAGESVTLLRDGVPTARLVSIRPKPTAAEKMRFLEEFQAKAAAKGMVDGTSAAHSQDFLYGEDGLPA